MNISFWNTHKNKSINEFLISMIIEKNIDMMILAEYEDDIKHLINDLGGSKKTILSFAGFGDLLLTATSIKSRNYRLGKLIGEKKSKEEIDDYINNTTIEGLYTLKSIKKLLDDKNLELPIIDLIYNIIYGNSTPETLVKFLIEK